MRAIAGGFVTPRQTLAGTAFAVAAAVIEIPLLFAVGRRVFGRPTH